MGFSFAQDYKLYALKKDDKIRCSIRGLIPITRHIEGYIVRVDIGRNKYKHNLSGEYLGTFMTGTIVLAKRKTTEGNLEKIKVIDIDKLKDITRLN